jgi:hypothetical protein
MFEQNPRSIRGQAMRCRDRIHPFLFVSSLAGAIQFTGFSHSNIQATVILKNQMRWDAHPQAATSFQGKLPIYSELAMV